MATSNPNQPIGRRRPVHWPSFERDGVPVLIFVTVCSTGRKPILANSVAVTAVLDAWDKADGWLVGRYAIMPDHIHFFCAPNSDFTLKTWMKYWKTLVSMNWPNFHEQPIWQDDFWDTQLRDGESYSGKWEYVRNNPVRHQLVQRAEDWPWAGEIHSLGWYEP